jgi:predicted dehydrogenase
MGRIASRAHVPAWKLTKDAELVCVVDRDANAAREGAERAGISRWSTDLESVLSARDIDAVDLCTPMEIHAEQAIAALGAGKHVLVEKPAAATQAEAAQMVRAATRAGRILMVAENWCYAPATLKARELVDAGVIGTPFLLHARHESDLVMQWVMKGDAPGDPQSTDVLSRIAGFDGGYFFGTGVHSITVARNLVGEFSEVGAFLKAGEPPFEYRERAESFRHPYDYELVIAAKFTSGAIGTLLFTGRSYRARPGVREFRVFGTHGTLDFDVFSGRVEWTANDDQVTTMRLRVDGPLGFAEEMSHFVSCIRRNESPQTSMADALATLKVVDATYESAATGRIVRISSEAPP